MIHDAVTSSRSSIPRKLKSVDRQREREGWNLCRDDVADREARLLDPKFGGPAPLVAERRSIDDAPNHNKYDHKAATVPIVGVRGSEIRLDRRNPLAPRRRSGASGLRLCAIARVG